MHASHWIQSNHNRHEDRWCLYGMGWGGRGQFYPRFITAPRGNLLDSDFCPPPLSCEYYYSASNNCCGMDGEELGDSTNDSKLLVSGWWLPYTRTFSPYYPFGDPPNQLLIRWWWWLLQGFFGLTYLLLAIIFPQNLENQKFYEKYFLIII